MGRGKSFLAPGVRAGMIWRLSHLLGTRPRDYWDYDDTRLVREWRQVQADLAPVLLERRARSRYGPAVRVRIARTLALYYEREDLAALLLQADEALRARLRAMERAPRIRELWRRL
jgi:hypothetical protein